MNQLHDLDQIPDSGPIYVYGAGYAGVALCAELKKRVGSRLKGLVDTYKTGKAGGFSILSPFAFRAAATGDTVVCIACADAEGVTCALGAETPLRFFDADALSRDYAVANDMRQQPAMAGAVLELEAFPGNGSAAAVLSALESGVDGAFRYLLATLRDHAPGRLADHVHAARVIRSLLQRIDPASFPADIRDGLAECADALTCLDTQSIEYYSLVFLGTDVRTGATSILFRPEGLMSPVEKKILNRLVSDVARPGMIVCEVGSFIGRGSTRLLAERVRELGGRVICVDPLTENFLGHSLWSLFQASVRVLGIEGVIDVCRTSSSEAASCYPDGHFDLVFIDGDHGYDMVMSDIRLWRSKVRSGGYLCGHDVIGHERDLPAGMIAPFRTERRDSQEGFSLQHAGEECKLQPGVVAAVCDSFGDDFQCEGHPNGIWWHRVR